MERFLFVLEAVLPDFFSAYGLITIFILLLSIIIKNDFLKKFDTSSNQFISIIGVVYLIIWISVTVIDLNTRDEESKNDLLHRMFGTYWFGFWLQPILWFSITQLLRFRSVRKSIILRLIFSFLLILSIEKIVMLTDSFSNDYLPGSWTMSSSIYPSNIFLELLVKIASYVLFIGIFTSINTRIMRYKTSKIK